MLLHRSHVDRFIRAQFLKHSIISPLCLGWVRAPHWPHVRHASQVLLVAVPVGFSGGSLVFAPPTADWPVSYELK